MGIATKYLPSVAWRTWIQNVVMISPDTYKINVSPIDANEPGARGRVIGNYLKDNVGHTYKIIASDATTVTVRDDFGVGVGAQTGRQGVIYKSVGNGVAPYLAPIYYRHLDRSALEYSRQFELDIIWRNDPNAVKIEFTNTDAPKIENYQEGYADDYGELPKIQLITYDSAGVEWVRQEVPIWYRINEKLTSIEWQLSDSFSGYIILSR